MQFQSLVGLWFGLALPAIVLMYILKRKYIDTEVPSSLLWNRVLHNLEANRPWQKLRRHWLLILQLLAASLLVLALMQPFVWTAHGAKSHVVLVVDRSASMAAIVPGDPGATGDGKENRAGGTGGSGVTETGPAGSTGAAGGGKQAAGAVKSSAAGDDTPLTRLELAKRQAAEYVRDGAGGSPVTVLAMGAQPEVLVSRETKADAVLAAIRGIEPFYGKTAYKETMSLASALTQNETDAEIRLFTDAEWTENAAGLAFSAPVHVEPVGGAARNIGIVQFGVKQGAGVSGTAASGIAVLKNDADIGQEAEVTLQAGGTLADSRRVPLEPGEQRTISFDDLPIADFYKIELGNADEFAADNRAFAFLSENRAKKALLLTEGNLFLEKALQLAGVEVVKVRAASMAAPPQGEFDMVVLDGTEAASVAGEPWQRLLGQKPVWYIRSGFAGNETNPPAGDFRIADHPVTKYISFQDTHLAKLWQPESVPWGQPIVSLGAQPFIYAGSEKGQPRLLFAFDLHQSDLPLRAEFPVLVQNAADWLGSAQAKSLGRAVAGEKKEIPVSPKAVSAEWVPLDVPGGSALTAEQAAGAVLSGQTVPNRPGLYQFVEREADGSEKKTLLEVTVDPQETRINERKELVFARQGAQSDAAGSGVPASAPTGAASVDTAGKASSAPSSAGSPPASGADAGKEAADRTRYPLLPWIVALIIIIVLAEWEVYRRGHSVS
ncbi:vWA domain-containing protein [Paenibacillus hamazuiensis]|uniref:vWA domain-containing protein n=1 Tax=Paenibacillus hamazuiensis TaxID=2936508 RepID=UPI00200E4D94|nr:BatA and WFA domain-containing protein [Paenibacillus hamazuiensis]